MGNRSRFRPGRRRRPTAAGNEPAPFDPAGPRVWTEPWMKWTGISLLTGFALWFRMPRSIRQTTVRAAFVAMLIFAVAIGVMFGVGWYFEH
jgi:hypothetical protein